MPKTAPKPIVWVTDGLTVIVHPCPECFGTHAHPKTCTNTEWHSQTPSPISLQRRGFQMISGKDIKLHLKTLLPQL